jgi:predicted phosphodiesterase
MRLLLLSDTHGFVDPRIVALAQSADRVVHAGDIGAAAVLDALRAVAATWSRCAGTTTWRCTRPGERGALALPEEATLELPGGS